MGVQSRPGEPGEVYAGFWFVPAADQDIVRTHPPAGRVEDLGEDLFESDQVERLTARNAVELAQMAKHHQHLDVFDADVPSKFKLLGAYLWRIRPMSAACDFGLSYATAGSPADLYLPDLWITWTDRAPKPLQMETRRVELDGRVGLPVVKTELKDGRPAVFQEWLNIPGLHPAARINSSLNWFEEGRLWAIQADTTLDDLLTVAASIRRV